jgi:2-dehydro-3-deoxyphosphogluconate aldolase/(4S)-4-hydroxy-2-oxoglutarate aldolase
VLVVAPLAVKSPLEVVRSHRLVPVVEIRDAATAADLVGALVAGGLPVLEITMRTEAAVEALRRASQAKGTLMLAAGTVVSQEQARAAVDAGAELIVSPGINALVVEYCLKNGIPVLPGVCTPTEIETARNYGLKTLKFFPAEAYGGARTVRALGDVYRDFRFVPTGGINLKNVGDYLKLSSVIACGGSWMAPADAIEARQFDAISKAVAEAVGVVRGLSAQS